MPKKVVGKTSVNVRLDEGLWRRVKGCAGVGGLTVEAWVEKAFTTSVEKQEAAVARGVDVKAALRTLAGASGSSAGSVGVPKVTLTEADVAAPVPVVQSPTAIVRDPEARCRRCDVEWRLHQFGKFKNRAELTGCTTWTEGL